MLHNFDVVCVGSAKIDIFLSLQNANKHLRYQKQTNELCVKFGEKVTVEKSQVFLGGNAANVSVGLARLGLNTAIVAEIGNDEFAQKIINSLKSENVSTQAIIQKSTPSSFSVILSFDNDRTIFSQHTKRTHNFNFENISSNWVYMTSLGEDWQNAYTKTLEFLNRNNANLVFNPGTLQIASGLQNLMNILLKTHALIVNKEEAMTILNQPDGGSSIDELLKNLQKLGPRIAVITDGKNGSFSIDENGKILNQRIVQAKVVEKTGAGDAYSSGFTASLIKGNSIAKSMLWGALNSSSCIQIPGAQNGLLYEKDIKNA